jgi:integrase
MKKKAKHGEGGVWAWRGKWRAEPMIGGERRNLGVHDTKAEAVAVVKAARQLHKARAVELPSSVTLREWGEVFFRRREEDGVKGVRRERSRWRRHVMAAPFADRPIRLIDRGDVVAWVRGLLHVDAADAITSPITGETELRATGRKLSRQTAQHCANLLSLALKAALDEGRVRRNVAADVEVPKARSAPKRQAWTFLDAREIEKATADTIPEPYRTIYTVAIYTGLRREDLWKLTWGDVTLSGAHPRVYVRDPKNGKPRDVPLLAAPLEALKRWRAMRPGLGDAPVFPQMSGKHKGARHPDTYDARWRDYYAAKRKRMPGWCRRAGISRHVRFHDLRHTCASHLVMGTWMAPLGLMEVREWMGHSSISVTQRYSHLAPEGLREKVRKAREGEA